MTLDLPFRLNHVNCFIAEGVDGWIVIDTGLHQEETVKRWKDQLADKTVSNIIISHYHTDHYGYAGGLQKQTGARVSMTKTDASMATQAWEENFVNRFHQFFNQAGLPKNMSEKIVNHTKSFVPVVTPSPAINYYLQEGERFQFGHYEYEFIFTPGHSSGLVCFYNDEKQVLLSTDHILPKITPNISFTFAEDENPLNTYLQSLKKVKKLQAYFVIPSHGDPFYEANSRIDEIIAHHHERLEETLDILNREKTAYDVCQKLFPKELTIHEIRFALGETLAHLEYLKIKGECKRELIDGQWWYVRAS